MNLFFSGIGGSGVSALAGFMAGKGHEVSGSDRLFDNNPGHFLIQQFLAGGIRIVRQNGSGITSNTDLAIFSTAVENNNPDYEQARRYNIRTKTRPEFLTDIVSEFSTIAVAGTSGKSTISGMLAFIMSRLDMDPSFIGGGRVKDFKTHDNPGNYLAGKSDLFIIEACESDGSIVNYRPAFSIIANLDLDHHSVSDTAAMFEKLSENTSGPVITNADDVNLKNCLLNPNAGFSIEKQSGYQALDIEMLPLGSRFTVNGTRFVVSLPGKHNIYNSLACIALLSEMGIAGIDIAPALQKFSGIERRFTVHLNESGLLVVDDYAHNPHKISFFMETMTALKKRICYIFQPHGYGPTRLMKDGYIDTFVRRLRSEDLLVVLPIYDAGGTAVRDISGEDLADGIAGRGKSAIAPLARKEVFQMLDDFDCYAVFGARDDSLSDFAEEIAIRLKQSRKG